MPMKRLERAKLAVVSCRPQPDQAAQPKLADGVPPWLRSNLPVVMGILNLSPDSFSDGGDLATVDAVLRRADAMLDAGAGILDLGAVSTRPGSEPVAQDEELRRLLPALEALVRRGIGPLSVDTFCPVVAAAALACGARMINDIRGARDPQMRAVLGAHKPWVCLMHMRGEPKTMQDAPIADPEVVAIVGVWLAGRVDAVVQAGVPKRHILVDPGIGFGKVDADNLALTRGVGALAQETGCRVLFGASRKSLIGRIANAPEPKNRLAGSLSLAGEAARHGAAVLRVHDVAQTHQFLTMEAALRG
jgi:dihydropteroate synthase